MNTAVLSINDRLGRPVRPRDNVRVLSVTLDPNLEDDEREMIEFMIGSVCEVDGIDSAGRAWVTMWWSCQEGTATSSVSLAPHQMERVG